MRQYRSRMYFSSTERVDLIKAWLATSLAFAVYFLGVDAMGKTSFTAFVFIVGIAAITAGAGFILHELSHKTIAHHFGVHSEFRSHDTMLILSIIIAFLGFIVAAPGAVYMASSVTRRESGIISAAGPAANIVLALAFIVPAMILPHGTLLYAICGYGLIINALLGAFNMIPLGDFDGVKILNWNKTVYFSMVVCSAILVVLAFVLVQGT